MTNQNHNRISFNQIRRELYLDVYEEMPQYKVKFSSFFKGLQHVFLQHCRRTLSSKRDLLEPFDRIIHKNGIALLGTWNITEDSPYTGFFKKDSHALIVVRASVGHTETTAKGNRSFGFVGKIFPTLDGDKQVETCDFITMEGISGRNLRHYNDAEMTNQTFIKPNSFFFKYLFTIMYIGISFAIVDRNTLFRPVDQIAKLGELDDTEALSPHWLKIMPAKSNPSSDALDFRDELTLDQAKNHTLKFDIYCAPKKLKDKQRNYQYIGYIECTESILSKSVDNRLHFQHAKIKKT